MAIGDRIKFHRERVRMTREDLAKRLNTTPQNIYKYENGIVTNIPIARIEQMAKIFDIPPERLTGWSDEQKKEPQQSDLLVNGDPELTEILTAARDDPNIRMLFSVIRGAKPEDIRKAIEIIKVFREQE